MSNHGFRKFSDQNRDVKFTDVSTISHGFGRQISEILKVLLRALAGGDSRKCSIHQKWENQEALFDPKLHSDIQENWKFIISSQTFM